MKTVLVLSIIVFSLCSCDCSQKAEGVVLDRLSRQPVADASVTKFSPDGKPLEGKPISHADGEGRFRYSDISGGLTGCPDLVLHFAKPGFQSRTITLPSGSINDSIWLERIPFQRDSFVTTTLDDFNREVDRCIKLLQAIPVKNINEVQHISIIRCLNTISLNNLAQDRCVRLLGVAAEKKYAAELINTFPNWTPNRGMGIYIRELNVEYGGSPGFYSVYKIQPH